jgi:hypothetical protein
MRAGGAKSRPNLSPAVRPLTPFLKPLSVLNRVLFGHDVPLELTSGLVEHLGPADVGVEGDNQIKVEVRPHGPVVLVGHEIQSITESELQKFGARG